MREKHDMCAARVGVSVSCIRCDYAGAYGLHWFAGCGMLVAGGL